MGLILVQFKVRGMFVKGMGRSIFRIIPLTFIPLTFLRPIRASRPIPRMPFILHFAFCILHLSLAPPMMHL
jgi:hypothetical protein